jgi:glycosyltransferase involved in cell wall biosynthesis
VPTHLALMDVTPNKRGSFESYTVRLAERLAEEGWRSVQAFWGPPPGWLRDALEQAGAVVHVISDEPEFGGRRDWPAGPGRDWRFARVACRYVRAERPDVTHLHFCVAFSLLPLMLRLAAARNVLFTEHISLPFIHRQPLRDLVALARNRLCMSSVTRMLAVSDFVRRRLVQCDHVPSSKVTVLYNGIDLSRFQGEETATAEVRERLGVAPEHCLVVTVGQLIDFKGIHVLVDAAARLRSNRPVTVLVVGEGARRAALEAQAARLGVSERCRFLGRRDDVADILRAADLFVLPSVWDEALGYAIVEAMAAGRAVVATRAGGIPEVVQDGETGLLVERGDADALAAAIETLVVDDARRSAMGRRGREVAHARFSIEVAIEQTVALYRRLAGQTRPQRSDAVSGAA